LKRALKSTHEDSVWDHLAGTVSASFEAGEHGQIAVKVVDDRGMVLVVVAGRRAKMITKGVLPGFKCFKEAISTFRGTGFVLGRITR
jgi:hypothetical protein